jgi:hypothetical protein
MKGRRRTATPGRTRYSSGGRAAAAAAATAVETARNIGK